MEYYWFLSSKLEQLYSSSSLSTSTTTTATPTATPTFWNTTYVWLIYGLFWLLFGIAVEKIRRKVIKHRNNTNCVLPRFYIRTIPDRPNLGYSEIGEELVEIHCHQA